MLYCTMLLIDELLLYDEKYTKSVCDPESRDEREFLSPPS